MTVIATGLKPSVRGDVTAEFLANGGQLANLHRHEVPLSPHVDVSALRAVVAEGIKRRNNGAFGSLFEYDGWMAPRVHYCLRLTTRQASSPELWLRLGLVEFSDYVRSRWLNAEGAVSRFRYTGEPQFLRRNALSRLWWAAENARNGSSYSPVAFALSNAGYDQYVFDLRYSHYRPAVIALLDALKAKPLDFTQMKKLSNVLNVALGSRCLESLGGTWMEAEDLTWIGAGADPNQAIQADVDTLDGPTTTVVDLAACGELRAWLGAVVSQVS